MELSTLPGYSVLLYAEPPGKSTHMHLSSPACRKGRLRPRDLHLSLLGKLMWQDLRKVPIFS